MRKSRKQEHIENYLLTSYKNDALFDDIFLEHMAISERSLDEIDTEMNFLGHKIAFPFMINAITGGSDYAKDINIDLAKISSSLNIPMAVGSQKIALDDKSAIESFKVVREHNKDGLVISNLGALCNIDEAKRAVEMINANAIQIHLNLAQELVMAEGDRDFNGVLSNIESIVKNLHLPVIVKEVGTGINGKTAKRLYDIGVRYIDVAGKGGSNFVEIEDLRDPNMDSSELYEWGIPTALALLETSDLNKKDLFLISSGGVKKASDMVKSLVVGADMCAGSGEIINYLLRGGYDQAYKYLLNLKKKLKMYMLLLDVGSLEDLKKLDYKITGKLKDLYNK